ncbi:MAG: hypothetical protein JG764_2142 [Clostridiales bacterium]|jgi:hypothetical protein|nr:hypothetical protein [Clostridiales bacterium]
MDTMPLITVLFVSCPEEMMISALGLLLFGIKPNLRKIILIGFIQAVISFFIRLLPVPFGIHTLLQIPLFILVIFLIMRIPFLIAAVCLLVSFTIYVIIDATFAPLILNMTNIPLDQVLADGKLRILFFLPQGLVMLLVVLLVFFFNFKLIDLSTLIMSREDEEWKR